MKQTKRPKRPRRTKLERLLDDSEKYAFEQANDKGFSTHRFYNQHQAGYLSISGTIATIPRIVDLYGLLIRRFYEEGYTITVNHEPNDRSLPSSALIIENITIPIRIRERFVLEGKKGERIPRNPKPSNILILEFFGYRKAEKSFQDSDKRKLEDRIDEIIEYLKKDLPRRKQLKEEEEKCQKEWEQEKEQRCERRRKINTRLTLVKSVMSDIYLYEKAKVMREACERLRGKISDEKIQEVKKIADWIDLLQIIRMLYWPRNIQGNRYWSF